MTSTEDEIGLPAYYDRTGVRISLARYLELARDPAYKILARTVVGDDTVVTAWLGDAQWNDTPGEGPLIYGTISYRGRHVFDHSVETFASTEESALSDHATLVEYLSSLL